MVLANIETPPTERQKRIDLGNGAYQEMAWINRHSKALEKDERQSVIDFEDKLSMGGSIDQWFYFSQRPDLLPDWRSANRGHHLRRWYRDPRNWMVQGAFGGLNKHFSTTPWEVKGTRGAAYFQELFASAQFGSYGGGWSGFWDRVWLDYLTQDGGAYIEIIGPGKSTRPLTGKATGLAHLDALRCTPTGNPEFPVIYWSRKTNEMHRMHKTRVARFVDMPDGDEGFYGRGLCALSRVISIADAQIKMSKYVGQRLDDLPPAGLLVLSGITGQQWKDVKATYESARGRDGADIWANTMTLLAPDPAIPVEAKSVGFSDAPEHFDYREYTEIHVNAVALTLGVDPQDIWPLTGAPLGTGAQSGILHSKARGKMFGSMLTLAERFINFYILPNNLEFNFKFEDSEADKERAANAEAHAKVAETLSSLHSKEVALQYLADNVESFRDVLLDEAGELIALPDDDPKTNEQTKPVSIPDTTTAEDATPIAPGATTTQTTAEDGTPLAGSVGRREHDSARQDKQLQAVRLDFEGDVEDTISAARGGKLNKRRFSTLMRAHINKYGRDAYEEGLKEGGVDDGADDTDLGVIAKLVSKQTPLVAGLADVIYSEAGLSDEAAVSKPAMWFNKSIVPFHQGGVMSADKNGMYEWVYGSTEHCKDCKRLNGQKHRLKSWHNNGWLPQASRLECNGFNCKCNLKKTTGSARGRF